MSPLMDAAEVAAKALLGGLLVVAFAVLAQTLWPKQFAGVFAAVPSVALASLVMTGAFDGSSDARRACLGMVTGAPGFVLYGLAPRKRCAVWVRCAVRWQRCAYGSLSRERCCRS